MVRSFIIGSGELADQLPTELPFGAGTVGWVAEHRQPLYWTDNGDARVVPGVGQLFLSRGLRFRLVYPITIGERVLGVFAVNRPTAVPVTPETEALLRSLAAQAALALDHARLFSETARRLEETRALLDVAEILNSTLNSKQLLKRAAIRIAQVCHVDRCSIERWDGKSMSALMSQFADGQPRPELWARFAAQPPWTGRQVPAHQRVIDTRRPVVINDTSRTDLLPPEWVEKFGIKSWMSVPLVRQDQVIGVLNLDYSQRTTRFESWQVDLAMTIAGQLALSLGEHPPLRRGAGAAQRDPDAARGGGDAVPARHARGGHAQGRARGGPRHHRRHGRHVLPERAEGRSSSCSPAITCRRNTCRSSASARCASRASRSWPTRWRWAAPCGAPTRWGIRGSTPRGTKGCRRTRSSSCRR